MRSKLFGSVASLACLTATAVGAAEVLNVPKGRFFSIIYSRTQMPVSHVLIEIRATGGQAWDVILDADVMPRFNPIPARIDGKTRSLCIANGCDLRISATLADRASTTSVVNRDNASRSVMFFAEGRADRPNTVVTLELQ